MSVPSLMNTRTYTENRRSSARQNGPAEASFQARLDQFTASVQGPDIHLRMPRENTVFSGGCAGRNNTMQELYAEYTADSTPEDPVVRISGTSDSGPFDFTCHVHDIDPSNASYAELTALYGHLMKTEANQSGLRASGALPTGLTPGDVTEKRDYLRAIEAHRYDRRFGSVCRAEAEALLALYQPHASGDGAASGDAAGLEHSDFVKTDLISALYEARLTMLERMKLGKEKQDEEEAWEHLMEQVDAWIESLRGEGSIERSARAYAAVKADEADRVRPRRQPADAILDMLTAQLQGK